MASISLRSYNKEIEHLIDQGQLDEAIGHCMHILQSVPKHLGTYRLLGKALLESKRFSDATDIFQRVLSAVPDDFVANVGMSIIRENEKNSDMAIWHMERAYESQPANTVVQDELRRLYGRRDGIEPPRIRLTRGALARMYVRGHLYRQAIGELRAALVEDPQRPDLQVLLADMYYQNGQKVEAVDTCSTLLKKYPFCLEANRILTAILPETERKDDAVVYLQRVVSLDPYYGKLTEGQTSSDQVPDQAITLEKLAFQPGQNLLQAPSQPDWAASLGAAFETPKVTDSLPDWLVTPEEGVAAQVSEDTGPAPVVEAIPTELPTPESQLEGLPDWMSEAESPVEPTAEIAGEENLPDFLKEAGWGPSTGEFTEEAAPLELQDEEAQAEEISKAEIPDWLQQMAPPEEVPPSEIEVGGEVPPWLQENPPGSTDTIISWLKAIPQEPAGQVEPEISGIEETGAEPELPSDETAGLEPAAESTPEGWPPGEDVELPDWISEQNQHPTGVTDMLPSWLPESQKPVVADSEAALGSETTSEIPDWLQGIKDEIAPSPDQVEAVPGEVTPLEEPSEAPEEAWIENVELPQQAVSEEEIQAESPVDELAVWLNSLDSAKGLEETPPEEPPLTWEAAIAEVTRTEEPVAEVTPTEELPDWLISGEAEQEKFEEAALETEAVSEEVLPAEIPSEAIPEPEAASIVEPALGEVPDWLQELEALETSEEGILAEEGAQTLKEELPAELEPTPEAELPDWLSEIETAAVTAEETAAVESDSLEDTKPRVITLPTEPVVEMEPAEEAPVSPEAAFNLEDPDAALAWLESLAAHQGIPQDQLTTSPEDRPVTPDWLEQAGQEAEARGELTAYVPTETTQVSQPPLEPQPAEAETPTLITPIKTYLEHEPEPEAQPAEEIPDWLLGIETAAVTAEETAPSVVEEPLQEQGEIEETTPVPVAPEEVPAWFESMDTSQPEIEAELESTAQPSEVEPVAESAFNLEDPDAALAWLESLAAQQGIPQEQLTTAPEERPSTPDWLEQAGQEAEQRGELSTYVPSETTQVFQPPAEALVPPVETPFVEEPAQIQEPVEEAEPIQELPDWLKAMESTEPMPVAPTESAIPESAPDWLQEFESIAEPKEIAQPAQEEAEELPVEEELPSWLMEEVPEEEAAPSGIPEAPTWISEVEPEPPSWISEEPVPQVEPETVPAQVTSQPRLDLNTASLHELENLPGMGFILAQTIMAYRETNGPFTDVEELIAVPGMDEGLLDQIKDALEVKGERKPLTLADRITEPKDEDEKQLMEARRLLVSKDYVNATDQLQGLVQKRLYLPEIIHDLQEITNAGPDDIYVWQSLGDAYMRNDQLQEALDAYSKAEKLLR